MLHFSWHFGWRFIDVPSRVRIAAKTVRNGLVAGLVLFCSGCIYSQPHVPSAADVIDSVSGAVVAVGDGTQTLASGFFVTPQLVVTNEHVWRAGGTYIVHADGRRSLMQQVFSNAEQDIAIFRVSDYEAIVVLPVEEHVLRVGEPVIAIGNPFGTGLAASTGIISALPDAIRRPWFLQTDAAINPGNSGGPLINLQGEIVGVVTNRGAIGSGVGFALSVNELVVLLQGQINGARP